MKIGELVLGPTRGFTQVHKSTTGVTVKWEDNYFTHKTKVYKQGGGNNPFTHKIKVLDYNLDHIFISCL